MKRCKGIRDLLHINILFPLFATAFSHYPNITARPVNWPTRGSFNAIFLDIDRGNWWNWNPQNWGTKRVGTIKQLVSFIRSRYSSLNIATRACVSARVRETGSLIEHAVMNDREVNREAAWKWIESRSDLVFWLNSESLAGRLDGFVNLRESDKSVGVVCPRWFLYAVALW